MKKCVILDRDGVINQDSPGQYVTNKEEWIPISGSIEAIFRLKQQGVMVAVATNQSGIGRGYYTLVTLHEIHTQMNNLLANEGAKIDYIAICPHLPDAGCECRKPKPGMLYEIAKILNINLADAYFVGDKLSDLQAAEAAGCQGILVKTGHGAMPIDVSKLKVKPPVFENLAQFVDTMLTPQKD